MIRLKKRSLFLEIASGQKKWVGKTLILQVLPRANQVEARVGFTVTKKMGIAVTRNRIKRRFKSAVFELEKQFKVGYDYVIIARKPAYYEDFMLIKNDIEKGIKHLCV